MAYAFGGKIIEAREPMHGKTSLIYHKKEGILKNIPSPFKATRYHSLVVEKESLPPSLKITAWTKKEEIMGIQHKEYPSYGVQFHPDSILTDVGKDILRNFLNI